MSREFSWHLAKLCCKRLQLRQKAERWLAGQKPPAGKVSGTWVAPKAAGSSAPGSLDTLGVLGKARRERQPLRTSWAFAEWLDLRALTEYACVSERTIRSWMRLPEDPLPSSRIGVKMLVSRRDFDLWLKRHPMKSAGGVNIGAIVDEIVGGIRKS